jgi:hypothetical protein
MLAHGGKTLGAGPGGRSGNDEIVVIEQRRVDLIDLGLRQPFALEPADDRE